jgi:exosortase
MDARSHQGGRLFQPTEGCGPLDRAGVAPATAPTAGCRLSPIAYRLSPIAYRLSPIALLALYLPVFAHAVTVWSTDQEFSFAFLVPPIALGLLWLRRREIRAACGPGSNAGLLALVGGLLLLVASARSGVHAIGGASFAVTVLGAAAYVYGIAAARALFFPVAFLTSSLVLFRGLLNSLGFALQELTARYAAAAAALCGVPVRRVGVDLFVGTQFHFVVAEACSGLSSLLALLCLGTLIVGLAPLSLWRRSVLVALVVPIVLVANVVRVALVLVLARVFGLCVAHGFIHGFFSAALFLAALGLFLLVGSLLGCYPRIAATA